jgi:hypothetical protein
MVVYIREHGSFRQQHDEVRRMLLEISDNSCDLMGLSEFVVAHELRGSRILESQVQTQCRVVKEELTRMSMLRNPSVLTERRDVAESCPSDRQVQSGVLFCLAPNREQRAKRAVRLHKKRRANLCAEPWCLMIQIKIKMAGGATVQRRKYLGPFITAIKRAKPTKCRRMIRC